MNLDKRKRSRVQGGWAGTSAVKPRSDRDKIPLPQVPAWIGKDADQQKIERHVYTEPEEVKVKPKVRILDKPGVYDLSVTENGVSRIRLFHNFIEDKEGSWIYDQLFHELPWKQRSDVKNGESYLQPRLTAWFGEHGYSYSGVTHQPEPKFTPTLQLVKSRVEENTGLQFNSVLANLYRDGHDLVAWHADNEPALGDKPTIVSVSFGDTRNFEMRQNPPPGADRTDYTYSEHVTVPLTCGSLLIMEGATQEDWQHRIPREYHDRGPRINLTFRTIYPESKPKHHPR